VVSTDATGEALIDHRATHQNWSGAMYQDMYRDGTDWLWMVPMMLLWIIVVGGVAYAAVRLAIQHSRPKPPVEQ
jgi:hypothetical protein